MRHIPETNPFQTRDQWPGASESARRALSQMNLDGPHVQRTLEACRQLKLKTECPVYREVAVSHIGIPSKKIAIYFRPSGDRRGVEAARERWRAMGWELISVAPNNIERTPSAELVKHLDAALKELSK